MLKKGASIKTSASSALTFSGSIKEKLSRQSSELSLSKTILIQQNKRKSSQQGLKKARRHTSDKTNNSNLLKFGQITNSNSNKIDPKTGLRSILKRKTNSQEKNYKRLFFADEIDESIENDIYSELNSPIVNRSRFISPVKTSNRNLLLNQNRNSMKKSIDDCVNIIPENSKKKKLVEVIEVLSYRNFDIYSNGKQTDNEKEKKEKEKANCSCACSIF